MSCKFCKSDDDIKFDMCEPCCSQRDKLAVAGFASLLPILLLNPPGMQPGQPPPPRPQIGVIYDLVDRAMENRIKRTNQPEVK